MNRRTDGTPSDVSVTLKELGLQYPGGYNVEVCNYEFNKNVSLTVFNKILKIIIFLGSVRRCELRYSNAANKNKS